MNEIIIPTILVLTAIILIVLFVFKVNHIGKEIIIESKIMNDKDKEYFIDSDNDGHWFVIPTENYKEWFAWASLDSDDPEAWETPHFAVPINGSPSQVTFKSYEIE